MSSKYTGKITVQSTPQNPGAMILTYETGRSRKVIHLPVAPKSIGESAPHGAGSYHDPEHHLQLMERVDAMLRDSASQE